MSVTTNRRWVPTAVAAAALVAACPAAAQSPYVLPPPPDAAAPLPVRIEVSERLRLRDAPLTGRVVDAGGSVVAGAPLLFVARPLGSRGDFEPVGERRTRADGTFTLPVGRDSREVVVGVTDAAYAAAPASVEIVAPLRVTAAGPRRTLRNGQVLRLTGRLTGAGGYADGKLVHIQAIVDGVWRTIARRRAAASGAIRWSYRLRNTRRRSAYRFRLRVPAVTGQPWASVDGRRVVVRVRP